MTAAGITGRVRAAAVDDMGRANHGGTDPSTTDGARLRTWSADGIRRGWEPDRPGPDMERRRPRRGSGADPGRSSHDHADLGEHALALEVRLRLALCFVHVALVQLATNLVHSPAVH